MPEYESQLRYAAIAIMTCLLTVGLYHRIRSQQSGESLDRTREGWPLLIGIRLAALAGAISTVMIFRNALGPWAYVALPLSIRWAGIAALAASAALLMSMYVSLGLNITDTVVTRRDAVFVESGPYRFIRNPMYTGLLLAGLSLGVALASWLVAVAFGLVFTLLALRTAREERYLIARFGDRYRDYMKRVGRFLPRIR